MDKEKLLGQLEEVGLSTKESRVYLASLELGPSTAQHIAAKAQVSRPTTYMMIEALTERGLISEYKKGKKRYFVAGNPNHLVYLLSQKRKKIEKIESVAKSVADALNSMSSAENMAPHIFVSEGQMGIESVQELISSGDPDGVYELVNIDKCRKFLPPPKKEDKYDVRVTHDSKNDKILVYKPSELPPNLFNTRIVDPATGIGADVDISGSAVCFITYNDKIRVVKIIDENIAKTMKALFLSLWDSSKELSK